MRKLILPLVIFSLIAVAYPLAPAKAAVVNSVQRGSVVMPAYVSQPVNITINPVDPSRAFVVCSSSGFPSGVNITPTTAKVVDYNGPNAGDNVLCELTDSGTITLRGAPETVGREVFWFVVDFLFGVRVQRGLVDISNRGLPYNISSINISPVTPNRSFVIISKSANVVNAQGRSSFYVRAELVDNNTLEFIRGTTGLSTLGAEKFLVGWQVVEFEDSMVQRGLIEMDAFTRTVTQPITRVNPAKSIFLPSYYGYIPDSFSIKNNYPTASLSASSLVFSRPDDGQVVRIAWQVVDFTDASTAQQPGNVVTFGTEQPAGTPTPIPTPGSVPLIPRVSTCQRICPAGRPSTSSGGILLRISNPNGPAINTSITFNIPTEVRPVNLGTNVLWNEALRLLTVSLGNFTASEEKQAQLNFEGEPAGCVIYGALSGQWSPPPPVGSPNWQEEVNVSLVLPDEQCLPASEVQNLINQLRQGVGGIGGFLDQLRQNNLVQQIGLPAVLGVGAGGAVATAASAPFLWNLLELLRFVILGLLRFKKRKPWGTIYDETTHQAIAGATVKILDTEFQKVKETQITDGEGRFGFLVLPGSYYLRVAKSGYKDTETSVFNVKDPNKELPNLEVGLSSLTVATSLKKLNWMKTLSEIRRFLYLINPYLLVVGTALSVFMFILFPTIVNYVVLMAYVVLDGIKLWLNYATARPFGRVLDHSNLDPLPLSIVRAFNRGNNWLTSTHVSDEHGRFQFLLTPGNYYVTASKEGYKPFKSPELEFRKPGIVNKDIELRRGV